nr:hypothetical protein [Tanacetum cinerariifolium]GEX42165.1 hypothetical protein [Tanacetum cinerariifolium]
MTAIEVPQTLEYKGGQLNAAPVLEDEEEVSLDDEETKVKALMALTNEERISVGKESDRNGEWTKITIKKCINEQIPTQKKKILGIGQLTKDTFSFGLNDMVFVKSLADNSDMSITSGNLHKSSEAEDSTLPNQNTDEVPSNMSQRNIIDPLAVVSDSPASDYDSTDESSICNTLLLSLKKLDGVEPSSGPETVKSILKSKSTFKAETLKGITINEPSSAPAIGNKSYLASKTNSEHAGKLWNVKIKDDPPLAMVMKELNELKSQLNKKKSSYSKNKNTLQVVNRVMSSPNHPTTDIEDGFSSNFLDYTTASPNYFLASSGNISPDPPDNLSKYLLASPAISPFHDMQAYNVVANKPPIPPQDHITPPTILNSSLVLPPSLLFDPQYFFGLEELLPPKKQIHNPSSS